MLIMAIFALVDAAALKEWVAFEWEDYSLME